LLGHDNKPYAFILWIVAVLTQRICSLSIRAFGASWLVLNGSRSGISSHWWRADYKKISIGYWRCGERFLISKQQAGVKLWLKYSSERPITRWVIAIS